MENHSSRDIPVVRLMVDGEQVVASASSIPSKSRPEHGTVVPVEYRKNEFKNGKSTYQVIIKDGSENNSQMILPVMLFLGAALTIAGILIILIPIFC